MRFPSADVAAPVANATVQFHRSSLPLSLFSSEYLHFAVNCDAIPETVGFWLRLPTAAVLRKDRKFEPSNLLARRAMRAWLAPPWNSDKGIM